jgi:ABC-type antimicrobial peptide transport system permease subunit
MRIRDLVSISMTSLVRNKARAILTMLGIVIGIASVILMLSVGKAAERFLLVIVGTIVSTAVVTYGPENMNVSVWGSTPGEIEIFTGTVAEGRFLLDDDVDGRTKVAVIGHGVARELFGDGSAVGKVIKVRRVNYRVVGVMEKAGTRFFTKLDDLVYIPVTSAMDLFNKDRLNFLSLKPLDMSPDEAKEEVRFVLRDTHKLDNPNGVLSKDDFRVGTQEDAQKNAGTIGQVLSILLGSIAAISLVVGGIGIMNIMYVTVTERTSEIGLRKALGAKQADVLGQFLAEAIAVTSVGGVIGIIFGIILSWLTIQILNSFQPGWTFMLNMESIVMAFSVSAAIGIVFGFNPARRASKLSPIEALRYE